MWKLLIDLKFVQELSHLLQRLCTRMSNFVFETANSEGSGRKTHAVFPTGGMSEITKSSFEPRASKINHIVIAGLT